LSPEVKTVSADPASPFWQNAILYTAALFLLWEVFAGWRRGLIRSALHFGAFVASGLLGLVVGQGVAMVVGLVFPGAAFLVGLIAGAIVAFLLLGACLFVSAFLFKRTSQQPSGPARWIFGIGGSVFGLLTGLLLLWGGISLVRTSGALAAPAAQEKDAPASTRALATLKTSLEQGPLGGVVESIDILPTETYARIVRVGELSKKPDAMMRFLDDPGVQKILAHPRMQAVLNDPQVIQAAETQNYLVLIQSRTILEAATDPSLQKLVMSLDLQKALDHALPPAQNPAVPKPKP
jgi:hypothetical protein